MKKPPRKKARKRSGGKGPPQSPKQAPQTPEEPRKPTHQRFLTLLKLLVGTPLAVLGATYTFFGPPWPTFPVFEPGSPSSGPAFDAPFQLKNRSIWFSVTNLNVSCRIQGRADSKVGPGGMAFGSNVTFSASGTQHRVGANSSALFSCPIRNMLGIGNRDVADLLSSAQVTFV